MIAELWTYFHIDSYSTLILFWSNDTNLDTERLGYSSRMVNSVGFRLWARRFEFTPKNSYQWLRCVFLMTDNTCEPAVQFFSSYCTWKFSHAVFLRSSMRELCTNLWESILPANSQLTFLNNSVFSACKFERCNDMQHWWVLVDEILIYMLPDALNFSVFLLKSI